MENIGQVGKLDKLTTALSLSMKNAQLYWYKTDFKEKLFLSVELSNFVIFNELINSSNMLTFDINTKNIEGRTLLHIASIKSNVPQGSDIKFLETLLEMGADPKIKDSKDQTPKDYINQENKNYIDIYKKYLVRSKEKDKM